VFVDRTEEGKLTCDTFLLDLRHSVARRWMDLCTPCLGSVSGRRRNVPRFCVVVENNVGFYIRDLSGSIFDDSGVTQPSLELGDLAALVCKTNLHLHSWRSALPCTQPTNARHEDKQSLSFCCSHFMLTGEERFICKSWRQL
jgi:hypothetical protein